MPAGCLDRVDDTGIPQKFAVHAMQDITESEIAAFKTSVLARTARKPPATIVHTTMQKFAVHAIQDITKAEVAAIKTSALARMARKPLAMLVQNTEETFALNAVQDIT